MIKDLEFINRMQGIEKMTMALAAICTELLDKIKIKKLVLCAARFAMHANDKGFQLGYEIGQERKFEELENECAPFEGIENLYNEISNDHEFLQDTLIYLKAVYQAFNEVCEEENINTDQLITWFGIFEHLPEFKSYLDCTAIMTDEALKIYREVFKKTIWVTAHAIPHKKD